jgi:UDP:flavonoid glycosyltransferase YjiC (YdhE family)
MLTHSNPKKILFANVPADGHFQPLTGLAIYLKSIGHDVRWYTGIGYKTKIENLDIPYYPLVKALDLSAGDVDSLFPERDKLNGPIAKLNFDLEHAFIRRSVEYYEDIKNIRRTFDFDVMIADVLFTAIPFVRHNLSIPVLAVGVAPLMETSKDLAPAGLGITPSNNFFGKRLQDVMRWITDNMLFKKMVTLMTERYNDYGLVPPKGNVFNALCKESTILMQIGTPGFEYKRSDLGTNIRFIGALLPLKKASNPLAFKDKLERYKKVVLVTQGTVERDINKLLLPTLEAFKNSDTLVVVTTGGSKTEELRKQYPQENIVIEDFIPFDDIMPYVSVYITNGGYGGVMLSIENKVPIVASGVHEGKNEICARIGYFNIGINLKTEKPKSEQIYKAVNEVLLNDKYKKNITALKEEFARYNAFELVEQFVQEVTEATRQEKVVSAKKTAALI